MAKYLFPAVFEKEEGHGYNVRFPDVEGCYTCGQSLIEAYEMANDALSLMMLHKEETGREIPGATPIKDVLMNPEEFASYVLCDTDAYRRLLETMKLASCADEDL